MKNYLKCSQEELEKIYVDLLREYQSYQNMKLNLNMARGKPSSEQLDLSMDMLDVLNSRSDFKSRDGVDLRNYGICDGIPEIKEFISELTGIPADNFIVGGNSSLSMMFDTISYFMLKGAEGCEPWIKQGRVKFLCPAPGYDRHFAISEYFGMEMITVPMTAEGPDMDLVEKLVESDESIKGMWCVPKYSNPQGITYSDETVRRLGKLKTAAEDFRLIWDNAYFVHDLQDDGDKLLNIMDECKKNGKEDMPIIFHSTSKITFPGDGVAFMACAGNTLTAMKKMYNIKTVGFDKINQLRHLRFLKDRDTLLSHMKKHRELLKPRFELILNMLRSEFSENPIISWENPHGGYFISVQTYPNCAKRVVDLCAKAGVILTKAGATYPYGKDPRDSNIRLAPTYPKTEELDLAMKLFCLCVKIAFIENKVKG